MKSIAEIFDNSKELLDSISNFIDKYIGSSLLKKCGITKIVDNVTEKSIYEYADTPVDRRTVRGRRRAAAKEKGTDTVCRMVKEAKKPGIPFDFVLFDTWFSNPAQLVELKGMEVDAVAMIKKNSTKYLWTNPETGEGSKLDVKEIYSRNKKRRIFIAIISIFYALFTVSK